MRIFIAAITFGITIGGLFLFDTAETQKKSENAEENYAQIIQELNSQNQSKTLTPKPANKSNKNATKTPTPLLVPSSTATLITSLPSATPTPLLTPTPLHFEQPQSGGWQAPSTPPSPIATATPTESIQLTPTLQPTQQNDQITVTFLTSPIKQNELAQLDIKTAPQAQCAIKVTLPSGSQSSANGLEDKTADNSGIITWSWKINWNTKPGVAIIEIGCSKDSQYFSKTLQMEIIER